MKICDVVLNSIWYDPRVRKQIIEYQANGVNLSCVGMKCNRYDENKVNKLPCPVRIVTIPKKYDGKQRSVLKKIMREHIRQKEVRDAIISFNPDIIHANDLNALVPAYAAHKKLHCKLVYDSHEINVENYIASKRSPIAWIMRAVEKYIVKRVDLMICVSNAAADYFASEYKIKKPMVVTNCSMQKDIVNKVTKKHDGFEILNHGQFYRGRGYEELIDTAKLVKQFPDIKVCVRGFGMLENSMHEKVEDEKIDNFIFYPPVNVEELIPEASKSHVGVAITKPICLNFKLSVSNKLFEYVAAGLPVIMSDIPEHRYLNDKYNFGLILRDNTPRALADAITRLYKDHELYCRLSENARQMSLVVNWDNEFKRLIDIEKQMLEGSVEDE